MPHCESCASDDCFRCIHPLIDSVCTKHTQCAGSAGIQSVLQLANGLLFLPQQISLPRQLWVCILCLVRSVVGFPVSRGSQQEADSSLHSLASASIGTAGAQPTADDTSAAVQLLVLLTVRFTSQTSSNAVLPEEQHFFSMLFSSLALCIEKLSSHRLAGVVAMSMACLAQQCASYGVPLDIMEEPAMDKAVTLGMSSLHQVSLSGSGW